MAFGSQLSILWWIAVLQHFSLLNDLQGFLSPNLFMLIKILGNQNKAEQEFCIWTGELAHLMWTRLKWDLLKMEETLFWEWADIEVLGIKKIEFCFLFFLIEDLMINHFTFPHRKILISKYCYSGISIHFFGVCRGLCWSLAKEWKWFQPKEKETPMI